MSKQDHQVIFRARFITLWLSGGLAIFMLIYLCSALTAATTIAGFAWGVCAALCIASITMMLRGGIVLDARTVVVRQCRGRRLTANWAEVEEFTTVGNGRGGTFVAVKLRDGRIWKTQALAFASDTSLKVRTLLRVMNAHHPQPFAE